MFIYSRVVKWAIRHLYHAIYSALSCTDLYYIGGPGSSCSSSPCTNGATCVDVNVDTFICMCRDGFFGMTCENSEYCCILIDLMSISSYMKLPRSPLILDHPHISALLSDRLSHRHDQGTDVRSLIHIQDLGI